MCRPSPAPATFAEHPLCWVRLWPYRDTREAEGRGSGDGDKRERGLRGPVMMNVHEAEEHPDAAAAPGVHTCTHTHTPQNAEERGHSPSFKELREQWERHVHIHLTIVLVSDKGQERGLSTGVRGGTPIAAWAGLRALLSRGDL